MTKAQELAAALMDRFQNRSYIADLIGGSRTAFCDWMSGKSIPEPRSLRFLVEVPPEVENIFAGGITLAAWLEALGVSPELARAAIEEAETHFKEHHARLNEITRKRRLKAASRLRLRLIE